MQMLYNSDNFAVVQFDIDSQTVAPLVAGATLSTPGAVPTRGGYEIVDKFARKEIFIQGAMAEQFKQGVEALIRNAPGEDEIDAYLAGYAALAHQPVNLH